MRRHVGWLCTIAVGTLADSLRWRPVSLSRIVAAAAGMVITGSMVLMVFQCVELFSTPITGSMLLLFIPRSCALLWCYRRGTTAFDIDRVFSLLTEEQKEELKKKTKTVVYMAGGLLLFHTVELCVTELSGMPEPLLGPAAALGLRCLVVADVLLLLSSSLMFHKRPWRTLAATSAHTSNHNVKSCIVPFDLNEFSRTVQDDSEALCSICLATQAAGDEVSTIPCGHTFHRRCLELWLRERRSCPFRCPLPGSDQKSQHEVPAREATDAQEEAVVRHGEEATGMMEVRSNTALVNHGGDQMIMSTAV